VKNNNGDDGGCKAFSDDETIATWLDPTYHTGFIGKYLNQYGSDDSYPQDHCFDPLFKAEGWDDWQALVAEQQQYGYRISHNGVLEGPFGVTEYQTTKLAERAAAFITTAPLPFFLWVTPAAPHIEASQELCEDNWFGFDGKAHTIRTPAPFNDDADLFTLPQGDPFNEADVTDKPEPIRTHIPRMIQQSEITCTQDVWQDRLESLKPIDQLIGTIGTALANRPGAVASTVVVFTSDNGYYHGEHRLHKKVFPYEDGIRVPLVIRYPPSLVKQTFTEFVVNTDLAPTIADLTGVSPPPGHFMDGQSLIEMLEGQQPATWRKRFLVEHWIAPATTPIPTFFGIRTAPTDTLLTPNALYMEYGDPTPTEFEYYDRLDQEPYQNQMVNLCVPLNDCDQAGQNFPLRLTALKTCSGNGQTSCQTLEN
jgi:arylsulfatase A-like enzyme